MKAIRIGEFGDLSSLALTEVPDTPKLTGTEVLVRVHAAGLNRADLVQAAGNYPPPAGYDPNIPGLEFAGEIVECGDAVLGFVVGDRVFGIVAGEGQAELVLTDSRCIAKIPDNLSYVHAAAVPEVFITAHDAIFTIGGLKAGETLLVHAVGSGVGLAALQLANATNARVIGTSRTADKLDRAHDFGLENGIATNDALFADEVARFTDGKGANVILDLVGASYFDENIRSFAYRGRLVLVGLTGGRSSNIDLGAMLFKRASVTGTSLRARSIDEKAIVTERFVDEVLPLLDSGVVRPSVDRAFPAAEVADAYKYLASNESFGKVILEF
ncbi:MAG TPA: NAD(P)H-quinone oxidoreductase [Pyrinomonadaceae bacterium]|nr:NAD(P)H-quinone oxidoreductase [Pyrinomonadaceae bacterium]